MPTPCRQRIFGLSDDRPRVAFIGVVVVVVARPGQEIGVGQPGSMVVVVVVAVPEPQVQTAAKKGKPARKSIQNITFW